MAKKKPVKRRRNPRFGTSDPNDIILLTPAQAKEEEKKIEADRKKGII